MGKISTVIVIIVIMILVVLIGFTILSKQTYKPFRLERVGVTTNFCEYYYEECRCYGKLLIMESYPPQYQCNGLKLCDEMNETICEE